MTALADAVEEETLLVEILVDDALVEDLDLLLEELDDDFEELFDFTCTRAASVLGGSGVGVGAGGSGFLWVTGGAGLESPPPPEKLHWPLMTPAEVGAKNSKRP